MLSQAVKKAVGDQNPVIIAAQAHGYATDVAFLTEVASRRGVGEEIATSHINAYEETRDHPKRQIPFFAIADIEHAFKDKLAQKGDEVRAARKTRDPKVKKEPPRRCGSHRR